MKYRDEAVWWLLLLDIFLFFIGSLLKAGLALTGKESHAPDYTLQQYETIAFGPSKAEAFNALLPLGELFLAAVAFFVIAYWYNGFRQQKTIALRGETHMF